ncbi:MAG: hypothetical protein ACXWV8_08270 [Chitinophagaceae bacterium]
MSGDSKNTGPRRDDIDLIVLLERAISFLKKYKWLFVAAIIIGLLAGYTRYRSLPVYYKSRLILQSVILSNQNNIQIVKYWNMLLKSRQYTDLAEVFNCEKDILDNLKDIKAEEIQKIFTPTNPNGFIVDVLVTDISILGELQKGIVYGFENSESVKDMLFSKRTRLTELIAKTSIEVNRLDSTKRIIDNILSGKRGSYSSLIVDASGVSRQLIEMNEKLLSYSGELKFTKAVQVLQSFSKFKSPAGHNLFISLFLGLASCLFLAYLFALFNSIDQKLRSRRNTAKNHGTDDVKRRSNSLVNEYIPEKK